MRNDRRGGPSPHKRGNGVDEIIEKSAEHIRKGGPLDHRFLVEWPRQLAKDLGDGRTALRRLYDHVASINFRLKMEPGSSQLIEEGISKLRRFATYQKNRQTIKQDTEKWIEEHGKAVGEDSARFRMFYEFFQSVMAYLPR